MQQVTNNCHFCTRMEYVTQYEWKSNVFICINVKEKQ